MPHYPFWDVFYVYNKAIHYQIGVPIWHHFILRGLCYWNTAWRVVSLSATAGLHITYLKYVLYPISPVLVRFIISTLQFFVIRKMFLAYTLFKPTLIYWRCYILTQQALTTISVIYVWNFLIPKSEIISANNPKKFPLLKFQFQLVCDKSFLCWFNDIYLKNSIELNQ